MKGYFSFKFSRKFSKYFFQKSKILLFTFFFEKLKNFTLDTIIGVGGRNDHNHAEVFTFTSSKWHIKKDYPFSKDFSYYSVLGIESKFIFFGGYSYKRKVLEIKTVKFTLVN